MLYEGLDHAGPTERVRSHHQHLILLNSVEERSHAGFDCLCIKKKKKTLL